MTALAHFYDPRNGRVFLISKDRYLYGRREADVNFPADPLISRRHLRTHVEAGNVVSIEDLDSINKTYLNEKPVLPNVRRRLAHGDVVRFGNQVLIYKQKQTKTLVGSTDRAPWLGLFACVAVVLALGLARTGLDLEDLVRGYEAGRLLTLYAFIPAALWLIAFRLKSRVVRAVTVILAAAFVSTFFDGQYVAMKERAASVATPAPASAAQTTL